MKCSACGEDNSSKARFCAQCGARLELRCPGCGEPVREGQRFCSACGHKLEAAPAQPPPPEPRPAAEDEGERRQATVMFSDLSGYTAMNERLDPEEVEEIMGRIKSAAVAIIERRGGTVNQFIGDEVVALFGIPVARRDDPQRAVRAALELHGAVRGIGERYGARIGRELAMHTGINSGLVVTRRRDDRDGRYALTGDAVNTGARLLGLAAGDEVIVGPDTWKLIAADFVAEARSAIEVKGKGKPIVPYWIRSERAGTPGGAKPLVGRTDEVRQFETLARGCLERGRGGVIVVRGEAGIGKSRLTAEFGNVARALGFESHSALVLDFGQERGRDAVRSLVQGLLRVEAGADDAARQRAAAQALERGLAGPELEVFLYDLVNAMPPPALRAVHSAMDPAARDEGALKALCSVVAGASRGKPLALLVEDIHWADAWTLGRLSALAAVTAEHRVLLAMTTRFEGDPLVGAWRPALRGARLTSIDLAPLTAEDALAFAGAFLGTSEQLVKNCIERAEGNPLFLEQLLLSAEEAAQASLPGSIQSLVLARLDRLAAADRHALQAASVLGQRFSLDALRHMIEDPAYSCAVPMEHLLVHPEGADFLFHHALIRDGVYESLLKSRRRQLHARAAEWFDSRDAVLAAGHYERAEHPRAAAAHLTATRAEAVRFRYESALALAERGIAIAQDQGERAALINARAQILLDMGQAEQAIAAFRSALDASGEAKEQCRALIGLGAGMRITDHLDDGLAALARAEPLARDRGMLPELSRIHHLRGNLYFPQGRLDECSREHERALRFAQEAASIEDEAAALGGLGDAYYLQGRMRSSNDQFRRCVALCREHGLGKIEVANLHMLGWTAEFLNEFIYAVRVGREAIELAAKVSHRRAELLSRHLVAFIAGWTLGEIDVAAKELDAALPLARAQGARRFEAQNFVFRGLLELRCGNRQQAWKLANDSRALSGPAGMTFFGAALMGVLARAAPNPRSRAEALAEGEALLERGCVSHNYFIYYSHAIDAALEAGDWDEAERYGAALERYTREEPLPWSEFVIARGRALAAHGRGRRDDGHARTVRELRASAQAASFAVAIPALDAAIEELPAG